MSIQQNFPAISPSLSLNFARSKKLDPRITFTRTSSATRINETGLVEVVPANSPRFDHSYDPVSGTVRSLGLLVEEQRTNLLLQSENFATSWTNSFSTDTANQAIAPNGTNTGTLLVNTVDNNAHSIFQSCSFAATPTTFSAYVKYLDHRWIAVRIGAAGDSFLGSWDLLNGVTGTSTAGATIGITSVGNNWYRIQLTASLATAGSSNFVIGLNNADSASFTSYAGTGTGFYLWGAQLEAGAFPTSYIPTTTSTVTLTADNASMVGENFSSWYNPIEGTFFTSFRPAYNASATVPARTPHVLQVGNATTVNDNYTIRGAESNPYWTVLIRSASPSSLQFPGFNPYPYLNSSTQYKAALSVNTSLISVSLNGLLNADSANTTTVNHTTPFNKLFIGSGTGGTPPYELTGHISQLIYYSSRLPNDQLITLTK